MKKLIFGLFVAVIAFGGSAFTNVNHFNPVKGAKAITALALSQTTSGTYTQQDGSGTCAGTTNFCSYVVKFPNSIPDRGASGTYTISELNTYVANGWLTAPAASAPKGIYTP